MKSIENKVLSMGMVKDTHPLQQPEGSYPFALNAILESRDGDHPFITNEEGNIVCASLASDSIIVGHVLTDTNSIILFLSLNDGASSSIVEYNPDTCTITTIVESANLNFSKNCPIKALFRIRKGCERTVYFTDCCNPYRVINIDDIEQYGSPIDVDQLSISRAVSIPELVYVRTLNSGGNTKVGTYQFFIRYLDGDLNSTPWLDTILPVPITDEYIPINGNLNLVDGGINIVDEPDVTGGVGITNKSIQITALNLDESFDYYQIGVLVAAAGTGEASAAYILPPMNISRDATTYVYKGVSPNDILTTPAEFAVETLRIDKVGSHTQLDNRLYLGDLKYRTYDWATVQQLANNIEIKWVGSTINTISKTFTGKMDSVKNGAAYYANTRSYLRDEVYAFGIRGKYKSGHTTPVFHIPGRASIAGDTATLNVVASSPGAGEIALADVRHLNKQVGDTVQTWEVLNTADSLERTMSYYESSTDYPDTLDCNDVRIYPTGKIRHHKMPDSEKAPILEDNGLDINVNALLIQVDLTTFVSSLPQEIQDDVIDWELVRAERDDYNRTIIDKGYMYNTFKGHGYVSGGNPIITTQDNYIYYNLKGRDPAHTPQPDNFFYWSPLTLLKNQYPSGSFLRVETQFEDTNTFVVGNNYFVNNISNYVNTARSIEAALFIDRYKGIDGLSTTAVSQDVPPVRANIGDDDFINFTWSVPHFGINLVDDYNYIDNPASSNIKSSYVSIKDNRDIHSNLDSIVYHDLGRRIGFPTTNTYAGGDIFISGFEFLMGSLDSTGTFRIEAIYESDINPSLRHGKESYVREYKTYIEDRNEDGDLIHVNPEYLAYNDDFSKESVDFAYFPLPVTYDYCSDCNLDQPYRIVASEKSFQTEVSDNYRIFLANNFIDLNGDSGGITELISFNDNLYVLTPNYPVFIPTRPQTIQTNENTAYVGTGEIFSIPPKRLASTPYKYAGCKDFKSIQLTEVGTFYADSTNGTIHLLTDNVQEITPGMHNWFEENLPYNIDKQLNRLGYPKFKYKAGGINDIGILSTFDARHRRYIISKKDYEILNENLFGGIASYGDTSQTKNRLYLDNELATFWYLDALSNVDDVSLDDPALFINKSWTVSYSPIHQKWVSFHSYIPNYYINDGNDFWSYTKTSNGIWRHNNSSTYQTYYGVKYDHILDMIYNENPLKVKSIAAMEWKVDSTLNTIPQETFFDRAIFYNSYQSSGEKTISLKSDTFDVFNNASTVKVERVNDGWRINDIRNYANSTLPLWSTSWTDLQSNYYIDRVPNPAAIDLNTSPFELSRLKDGWFGSRVFFNPPDNIKLNTNIVSTQQRISYR